MYDNQKLKFKHNNPYTIGIEEEYMICHPETGDLIDKANEIISLLPDKMKSRFSYELLLSEIEINTPICNSLDDAMNEIMNLRNYVKNIGTKLGYRIGISGTHPDALAKKQTFVNTNGYKWVSDQLGYYAKRNITYSIHIHISVPNSKLCISAANSLRRWIPTLLALSNNSPFFEGELTRMKSSRTFQFGTFPRTNIPDTFNSFDEYIQLVNNYIETKSIQSPRQIWWKIRPHLEYGTIEFRMLDIQRSLKNTEMFVGLLQALTYQATQDAIENNQNENLSMEYLNDGLWKAARFGLDGIITDSLTFENKYIRDHVKDMINYCEPSLNYFNTNKIIEQILYLLKNGCECDDQIKIFNKKGIESLKLFLMDNVDYSKQ